MTPIVAITVSTNYHDLLPVVYHFNNSFFKHWIFVTEIQDKETISFLSNRPNTTILVWDFKNHRNVFDKGGAIRFAQTYVYNHFPDDWYLLIDSDICLSPSFSVLIDSELPKFDSSAIYGLEDRLDFESLEDLKSRTNFKKYKHKKNICGYFQLYKEKFFYNTSRDASHCDMEFTKNFSKRHFILNLPCAHLGKSSHWDGKRQIGSDFKQ